MRLSKQRAEKYAAYRNRYLFGPLGTFQPSTAPTECAAVPGSPIQQLNSNIGFLRFVGEPPTSFGTYLNVDKFDVSPDERSPEGFEEAPITAFSHGDNIIYASYAALNFACEYAILLEEDSLAICRNILLSFQRLGDHQAGLGETVGAGEHAGFMLRSDSADIEDDAENLCVWLNDPDDARNLEPSYDQYCALLSCLILIRRILNEASLPPEHEPSVGEVKAIVSERIERCVRFLAGSFWTILFVNADGEFRTAKRGAYCIHAAYPFAKIAVLGLAGDIADWFGDSFRLTQIGGFPDTHVLDQFVSRIKDDLPDAIGDAVKTHLIDNLLQHVKSNVIDKALDEVVRMFGGDVNAEIRAVLRSITAVVDKLEELIEPFVDAILAWAGAAAAAAALPFSMWLHKYYSKFMLQSLADSLLIPLGDWLALFGVTPPSSIGFDFDFSISFETPDPPGWWPRDPLGNPIGWVSWSKPFSSHIGVSVSLAPVWDIPVPLNVIDVLGLIVTAAGGALEKKPDLQMLVFVNNVGAETFAENTIDPVDSSEEMHNAFAMALTYRFFPDFFSGGNASRNLPRFESTMALIDSAPETFPKGLEGSRPWNENHRWMRAESDGAADHLYAGMDYMVPLMLAACHPGDVDANRVTLANALAPKFIEEGDMGIFKLPFQGPSIADKEVYRPDPEGNHEDTLLYVGVGWERGRGPGKVTLKWKDKNGADQSADFVEKEPARMITIPLTPEPVLATIVGSSRGYFLVQSVR